MTPCGPRSWDRIIATKTAKRPFTGRWLKRGGGRIFYMHRRQPTDGYCPIDLTTFMAASLVLGTVSLIASYIPARRAAKLDLIVSLRRE